jgi:cathepsin X
MMARVFFLIFIIVAVVVDAKEFVRPRTKTHTPDRKLDELVLSPLPHTYVNPDSLPTYYDIRNVSGINFASIVRSQMVPLYCGSCWAMSATSALNDRFKLQRKNAYPDIQIAVQGLLNCGHVAGDCNGGNAIKAYKWIATNGISDETCNPYVSSDMPCTDLDTCRICNDDDTGCMIIYTFPKFYVAEYGYIPSKKNPADDVVTEMMTEIYARGPIVCSLYTDKIFDAYRGGIMMQRPHPLPLDHDVTVSGWGEQVVNGTNVPYWIVRNSFGSWWGEFGFFRIQRGVNALGLETSCVWGTPKPF